MYVKLYSVPSSISCKFLSNNGLMEHEKLTNYGFFVLLREMRMETGAFIFLVVETTAIRAITKQTRE